MSWGTRSVTVTVGGHTALDDVSFDVEPGEIAVVVGGDGAGKTTLCRTLVGLEKEGAGHVSRPERTCFQPETSGVWGDLTVMENLEFVARGYRMDPVRVEDRISELLDVTQLALARDRLARRLSGGMRQKLGVAMAVLPAPDLVVLDEPTTGLDPVSRLEIWSFISRLAREGRAVVVTSTYVDEAQQGDSVVALDDGRLLASGSVADVLSSMKGRIFETERKQGVRSWRRGHTWRVWSPDGALLPGTELSPDLTDVITVVAMEGEQR